jgi:hypothetical protein
MSVPRCISLLPLTSTDPLKVRINDTHEVEIPRKLEKYDVLRVIDSGGFSVVILVTDRRSGEPIHEGAGLRAKRILDRLRIARLRRRTE